MSYVMYHVENDHDGTLYVRVRVGGMYDAFVTLVEGAAPWHAADHMRAVARELLLLASQFDHDYPKPGGPS